MIKPIKELAPHIYPTGKTDILSGETEEFINPDDIQAALEKSVGLGGKVIHLTGPSLLLSAPATGKPPDAAANKIRQAVTKN